MAMKRLEEEEEQVEAFPGARRLPHNDSQQLKLE